MDSRFTPAPPRTGNGCDSCKHSTFSKDGVRCLHPQRPEDKRAVVKWFTGCPQHEQKETT